MNSSCPHNVTISNWLCSDANNVLCVGSHLVLQSMILFLFMYAVLLVQRLLTVYVR